MMTRKSTIKEELVKEFNEEIEQVRSQGERQAEAILKDSKSEQEAMHRQAEAEIEREISNRRTRALSKARIEQRNQILRAEKEIIDELFEKLKNRLIDMAEKDPDRYTELLWTFFNSGLRLLLEDRCRVYLGENTERFLKRIEERENTEVFQEKGYYGLILESSDGRIRCNYTIHALLDALRKSREAEIRELIFGNRV